MKKLSLLTKSFAIKNVLFSSVGIMLLAAGMPMEAEAANYRTIKKVETVSVEVPVGCAPRLPYRLWVEYGDGSGEWRQVRWQNSSLVREEAEADKAMTPAGTQYQVKGFITGDNTTANGYPVTAQVTVGEGQWAVPQAVPVAETLPLDQVSIDGDNRLTWNRDLDIDHLLTLDVRQQLYNYRDTYGLPTDGYPVADGWDSPTTKLKGHGSGHYMSALAMAFACCQDGAKKARLRENITTMVNELRRCQERTFVWSDSLGRYWEARDFAPEAELRQMQGSWKDFDTYKKHFEQYGYGYLNAIPAQHCALIEMYRAYNNDSWVWAPYYSVHKQLAGLIDIATYIDDEATAQKALLTAKDMGLWVWNRLHYRTYVKSDGSQQERRQRPGNRYEMWNMYIAGEVGGMAESLARLSEMVSDDTERARLLEAASYFDSPAFFDPLARGIDAIRTRHANQHIPMVTGALRSYRGNENPYYYLLAENFWTMIQGRYRYAMGGVGNGEMFRQPYSQMTSMTNNVSTWGGHMRLEPTLNETCCAYNLAKLTKDLNCYQPDDARYMDYYERVLYNQLVGSVNPRRYQTVYQYAVGLNASKPWGNETPQESCCGGTGAENHVKYQEAVYFVSNPATLSAKEPATLWVALYMPTTARWEQQGVVIRQQCQWPAERSVITVGMLSDISPSAASRKSLNAQHSTLNAKFRLKLRVPYWATEGFDIRLNGRSIAKHYQPGSYAEIPARRWSKKDVVEVVMPFTRHIDFGPDKMDSAPVDGKKADFEPAWLGTLMYGPLAMATTGISTWDEATMTVAPDLSDITLNGATEGSGADAHLYTLSLQGRTFIPDYHTDRHSTHYLRLTIPADPAATATFAQAEGIDRSALRELTLVARSRIGEQQAWQALAVKVPEYAPWAPHAYGRMVSQCEQAEQLLKADEQTLRQEDIDKTASQLNAIINSMRPGNLPELEDMATLEALMERARQLPRTEKLGQALDYAGMVVRYVSDGSGTHDMIDRATRQLQENME